MIKIGYTYQNKQNPHLKIRITGTHKEIHNLFIGQRNLDPVATTEYYDSEYLSKNFKLIISRPKKKKVVIKNILDNIL